jgi:DNA-binding NarL/FixJ family response regulator
MDLSPTIKVLVVDDHPQVRSGISAIVNYQDDLEVVGQAATAAEAIALFESLGPDVTLVDLGLPDLGGIELITILRAKSATARFIVLTANAGGAEIAKALHAGAHAFLFKDGTSTELFTAIRKASTGGRFPSDAVDYSADSIAARTGLMARARDVMKWIWRGHSKSLIADEAGAAADMVKSHAKHPDGIWGQR